MPNRNIVGDYRYGYQGEFAETDPETGMPAFELRLYDPRINRWLTPDPMGEFASPYMSMGNNWASTVDPDGGETDNCCPDPIQLDEVVIIAKGGGGIKPKGISWTSETSLNAFAGNMAQWQDLTNHQFSTDPSLAYDQWDVSYGEEFRNYKTPWLIDATGFADGFAAGSQQPGGTGVAQFWDGFAFATIGGSMSLPILSVAAPATSASYGTAAIRTTIHGTVRIAGQGATRGGVLTQAAINTTKLLGRKVLQADGAIVYIWEVGGKYNIVIESAGGKLITTLANLSFKKVWKQAVKYGWKLF